jgi:hypothetical protein
MCHGVWATADLRAVQCCGSVCTADSA